MRADLVQEVAVVADDHHRALVLVEHMFEPANRIDIEVVRRLVEQQHIRFGKKRLGKQHAQLGAWRDLPHRQLMLLDGNLQPEQQFARTRLGGVAVVLGEMSLEIGRPHVIVVACLRICVDRIALRHRIPHFRVAHQNHVEYAEILERELILTQLAHAPTGFERYVARRGFKIAADDLDQGRLA